MILSYEFHIQSSGQPCGFRVTWRAVWSLRTTLGRDVWDPQDAIIFFLSLSLFFFWQFCFIPMSFIVLSYQVYYPTRHSHSSSIFFCRRLEVVFASFIIRNVVNCPWYTVPRLPPFVFSFLFSTFVPVTLHKTGRKIIYITQLEQEWQLNKLTLGQVYGVSLVSLKFQVVIVWPNNGIVDRFYVAIEVSCATWVEGITAQ